MRNFKTIASVGMFLGAVLTAQAASAQVMTTNSGVSWTMENNLNFSAPSMNTIDLGSTPGVYSSLPIMFGVSGSGGQITFSGSAALAYGSGGPTNPDGTANASNFLVTGTGQTTISFDTQQRFFSSRWGSVDPSNLLSFYNGSSLVFSVTGSQATSASGNNLYTSYDSAFSFAETGFTKVVMTTASGGFEMNDIAYSSEAVSVAPIPLNAASLGGLLSFLMMLAMRGKGGTQVMVRMAFASIMPRRRALA